MKPHIFFTVVFLFFSFIQANPIRDMFAVTHPIYTHDRVMERDARKKEVEDFINDRDYDYSAVRTTLEQRINAYRPLIQYLQTYNHSGTLSPLFILMPNR